MCALTAPGYTLENSSITRVLPEFSDLKTADTKLMEVDEDGNCLWSWSLFDHWDQLGTGPDEFSGRFFSAEE